MKPGEVPTTGDAELDAFFSAALPYLRGEMTPKAFEDKVGPSRSGSKRLTVYPWLLLNDNRNIINKIFLGARIATERHKLGLWERWLNEWQPSNPPINWRVYKWGDTLFDFVRKYREERAPNLPLYIEELVDLAYTRSQVMHSTNVEFEDVMDRSIFVRQYTHTSPQFLVQVTENSDVELPEPRTTLVIIYRSLFNHRPRFFYPAVPALLALARRTNTAPELRAQFTSVPDSLIDEGEVALVEHGIVPPREGLNLTGPTLRFEHDDEDSEDAS